MRKVCYVVTIPLTIRSFFISQLKFLADHGYDVTVICSDDGEIKKELGDSISYIPVEIPRGISVLASFRAIRELKKNFIDQQFDLIQYSTPNAALYSSIAAKQAGCRVRNYHLMGFRYLGASGLGRYILKSLERVSCHYSTSIECVSNSNMELGIREGLFSSERVTVVWNGSSGGVDLEKFNNKRRQEWRDEVRAELGYNRQDFVYGFVGRITGDKGINELLEAYFDLDTDAKLFLIGTVENEQTLNARLLERARNNHNIQIHAPVVDIERYFAAIDVLILPSYREGFGNVVIEAAAMGTPAIISDIPGPVDAIKSGETALVFPAKDTNALKESMRQIRIMDYHSMGQRAAQFAKERFDSKLLNEKILERKEELLGTNCNGFR